MGRTLVREVLETIVAVSGTDLEPEYLGTGNPEGEIDRQFVDSTKLREMTGWRTEVELRDGLIRTLDWYRDHPELRPEALEV
jgi:CDP-glucose 4,6-dehydratase